MEPFQGHLDLVNWIYGSARVARARIRTAIKEDPNKLATKLREKSVRARAVERT